MHYLSGRGAIFRTHSVGRRNKMCFWRKSKRSMIGRILNLCLTCVAFLGLVSYYRKFIQNFSTLAFPLIHNTQKNRKFIWGGECDIAFQNMKQALISFPILSYSTRNGRFVLETDASNPGIGAVLSQI